MLSDEMLKAWGDTLHASNDMRAGRENTTNLLHDLSDAAFNDADCQDWTRERFNALVWAQHALLMMPPVLWGIGDTLSAEKPESHPAVRNWCLLPTTTNLETSSKLVETAKQRFNPALFEDLKARAPAGLGDVFLSLRGANAIDGLIHMVCRDPGKPAIKSLDKCFAHLPTKPAVQYVLPIWQAKEQLDLWVSTIAKWVRPTRYSGLKGHQPLLVRFGLGQQDLAGEFEKRLILSGVLVGRQSEHDGARDIDAIDPTNAFHEDLAALVRADGPLTPEIYAAWVNSGVRLPEATWERHLRVVLQEMR